MRGAPVVFQHKFDEAARRRPDEGDNDAIVVVDDAAAGAGRAAPAVA